MNLNLTQSDRYLQFESASPVTCPLGLTHCIGCTYNRRCPAQYDALKKGQAKVTTQF